jgi:hypothetical protein
MRLGFFPTEYSTTAASLVVRGVAVGNLFGELKANTVDGTVGCDIDLGTLL